MSKRIAVLLAALCIGAPCTTVHADVDDQGPLTALTAGATATQPAVRIVVPRPTVEEIIREVWPDNLEERALRIAHRESRYECCVRTWCCYGVFQIYWTLHKPWLQEMGVATVVQLYDPRTNIQAAYRLYQLDGWSPWQT